MSYRDALANVKLRFTVPGPPVPCARARVVRGHAFTPGKTRSYEWLVGWHAKGAMSYLWQPPESATFGIEILVYRAARRGDFDNYAKAVCDGLTKAGVWPDDSRVEMATVELYVSKTNPRAEVCVWVIEPEEKA
jgi:Holliday junction resolvase RusA-like endonuclease